ncbi:hypothetical protein BBP40_005476 [Aspergillus hancockii]|nr:hypothetical protein BBP40_005476 [Aspergillus hancockii]
MAPSLRELIDFLLAEIALCGDQGASPSNILTFINTFYAKAAQDASTRNHAIDRPFQEKVWSWLTKNPEVSVGKDREYNALSLSDLERRTSGVPGSDYAPRSPIHVYVSEERTWLAITGHEPDESKVLSTEFALLSIIASRKSNGIAQTELVKLSGQDKRSVPKRTDMLQRKGYIEKRAIQIKSTRTSLCTLRKFMQSDHPSTESAGDRSAGETQIMDYTQFSNDLFGILREHRLVSRVDLKRLLGFNDKWRWRILSRALRKFERIGVLKRVKATSQFSESEKHYFACVKLLREPTEKDIELFHEFSCGISTNLEQDDNAEFDEDVEPNDVLQNGEALDVVKQEEDTEESGRILPAWTPDRTIHNLIFETVDKAGTDGILNQDIIRKCFGAFYRRPLENTMSRLVECWQLSQPLHLRHLAIVRDTVLSRTITQYNHFSATHFRKLVDVGESAWEAVEFTPKNPKVDKIPVPPVDAEPELDKYGLPVAVPAKELVKNGDVSLLECILVVNPPSYKPTSSDATAVPLGDGTYGIHYGHAKAPAGSREDGMGSNLATPSRLKREHPDGSDADIDNNTPDGGVSTVKRRKRPRDKFAKFDGMSEKQRLEALGLDETWTEYNILLIDRPNSGVYITPRGRRRPMGKRQGRPRISRIAVFKSPKLSSIPWFTEEAEKCDEDDVYQQTSREHTMEETPVPTSAAPARVSDIPSGPSRSASSEDVSMLDADGHEARQVENLRSNKPDDGNDQNASGKPLKRKRVDSPKPNSQDVAVSEEGTRKSNVHLVQTLETPSKKPREETRNEENEGTSAAVAIAADELSAEKGPNNDTNVSASRAAELRSTGQTDGSLPDETTVLRDILQNHRDQEGPDNAKGLSREPSVPQTPIENGKAADVPNKKKGSVGFIRRKIVMEIVEKAGGAFPLGAEIWYPFATAWRKTKYKETPDLRTIKSTAKHMIEAGKLRQLTFSGRDNKGVMVTKNIICKPDMQPDDPLILDMQKKMLAAGTRHYIPANTLHTSTGTFSTDGGLAPLRAARHAQKKKACELSLSPETSRNKEPELPHSLDDLFNQTKRRPVDYSESVDPRSNQFFYDNNVILRWELRNEELLGGKSEDFLYINQTVQNSFDSAPIEGNIRFDVDEPTRPALPPPEPRTTRQRARRSYLPIQSGTLGTPSSARTSRTPTTETPQNRRLERLNASMAAGETFDTATQPTESRAPLRRNRATYQLPPSLAQRIMTAIVVVRALAGGYEGKIVDWTLVSTSFPDHEPDFIQSRGKYILGKHRLQLAKMQSDFQERFLEAYATGQVPAINYDALETYDWAGIVDWANAQLDVPKSEKLPDLPATREQFDSVFELREELPTVLDEIYQTTQTVTVNRKRALVASVPFVVPIPNKNETPTFRKQHLSRMEVVKSWIRANVVTPEETYQPSEARSALSYMKSYIDMAIDSLTTERVISMGNRGRVTPGRNYDITDHFLFALGRKRHIESTQLRRAAKFKTQTLDPALQSERKFDVQYNAEDGDILAMINLAAERRVILKPRDPPADKYGLTDGGYMTRQMDKDKLRFAVEVHPVEGKYIYGNPIEKKIAAVPPPCPPRATNNGDAWVPERIPLWCDIHGGFIKLLWELSIAAVVGCVASRPGINAAGVASMIKPAMGAWEIELLLKWMAEIGVVRQEGHTINGEAGWAAQEWWWMILC